VTLWRLLALVCMLAMSAFFAASETALFSLRQHQLHRLRQSRARAARTVLGLLEHPRRVLVTVLVGNTTVNLVLSVLAVGPFVAWLGPERGPVVATFAITLLVLVGGEIVPKTLAVGKPLAVGLRLAVPLATVQRLLSPVTRGVARLADATSDAMARRLRPRDEALTEAEIKTLVTMGWEQGVVGAREKEFIHNVFHLDDRQVGAIVTPRSRVFALDLSMPLAAARSAARQAGFSRIPLYAESSENLTGYVEVTDLLWGQDGPDPRSLRELRRELPFYPSTKHLGELLSEMHRQRQEIAAVVDEHGDFAGIVSLEDAVEQVVGEIFDLHDLDRFRFTSLPDGDMLVTAQMEIGVFDRLLDVPVRDADAETIGGWLINRLGRIPAAGEAYEAHGLRVTVEQAAANRIITLRVRRLPKRGTRR
jgi:putative hemolysin